MRENSLEWFNAEIEDVRRHVDATWPTWMKNTADLATATFPVLGESAKPSSASPNQKVPSTKENHF
jgi:hypothetical protein